MRTGSSIFSTDTTRSKTCSAPVLWCRDNLNGASARALVVNSGNANAFTGKRGVEATRITAAAAAEAVGCSPAEVFLSSTGVIGEPLDASKFAHLIAGLAKSAAPGAWHDAARAIMTTDTFPKLATRKVRLGGTEVVINGFAKGAGMIAPDLATMLVYIFTDAAVASGAEPGSFGVVAIVAKSRRWRVTLRPGGGSFLGGACASVGFGT